MCLATNIARRAGSASYYARLAVPKDLQPALGKRELWQSLRTKDAREAKARVHAVLDAWHAEFAELRRRRQATPDDLQAATWEHYQDELAFYRQQRLSLPTQAEQEHAIDAARTARSASTIEGDDGSIAVISIAADALVLTEQAEWHQEQRAARKAVIKKHLATGETALVEGWALEVIRREGWAMEPGTPDFRALCQRLQRAELEALLRVEEQDTGDFTGTPRESSRQGATSSAARRCCCW